MQQAGDFKYASYPNFVFTMHQVATALWASRNWHKFLATLFQNNFHRAIIVEQVTPKSISTIE